MSRVAACYGGGFILHTLKDGRISMKNELSVVEWLLCIFCSGIGCIVGIVYLIQGKSQGGMMIGLSLLFAFLWAILRAVLTVAVNQGN
jgi:hypothetical protein